MKRVDPPLYLNAVFPFAVREQAENLTFAVREQAENLTTTPSYLPSTSNRQTNHPASNTVPPSQALPANTSTTQSLPAPTTPTPISPASTPPSINPVIPTTGWSLLTEMAIYDI